MRVPGASVDGAALIVSGPMRPEPAGDDECGPGGGIADPMRTSERSEPLHTEVRRRSLVLQGALTSRKRKLLFVLLRGSVPASLHVGDEKSMKVTVYGCGDESKAKKLIENRLGVDYELPLGGAHLAYRAAESGHDVVLCDPKFNLSKESRRRLESAGVELETDDKVGAEHGEVQILFTPFGRTVEIVGKLIDDVREGAVLCTTCTCPPIALYYGLERELRTSREDVGISSFHPAGIPGTETQDLVLVADAQARESGIKLASERQVARCVDLAEDMGYEVYVLDPEIVPLVGDMSVVLTVGIIQAVCDYFKVARVCGSPTGMIEEQVEMVLATLAYLISKHGLNAFEMVDGKTLVRSLRNMALTEEVERIASSFERRCRDLINGDRESMRKLSSMLAPPGKLVDRIREVVGEAPIRYAIRKFFEERRWST